MIPCPAPHPHLALILSMPQNTIKYNKIFFFFFPNGVIGKNSVSKEKAPNMLES